MKYSLILSRALFTLITVLLIVTVTRGDCTPLGILLSEQTSSPCAALEEKTLTRQSKWSIHWPNLPFRSNTSQASSEPPVVQASLSFPPIVSRLKDTP